MKSPQSARTLLVITLLLLAATPLRALDASYERTLLTLCDALVATQITDATSPEYGALVCPSTNPQIHPLHSRAAEAVYPFAIAYRNTHNARYRDAAVILARWLISKQQLRGAWGEAFPKHDAWTGTTSDQLASLAGAYPILRDELTPADRALWEQSMRRAAEFVVESFPVSNINYQPTGAVALLLTAQALRDPVPGWIAKADALVTLALNAINPDALLTGEGTGVDLGYNLAQSIGYLALYGILKSDDAIRNRAAELLRAHAYFVYPNGSIDNSWGTRSFKWTYESGTKTAPGVYFSFALLADKDPSFGQAGRLCLSYLTEHAMHDGLVTEGPDADEHDSVNPPCLYSTFARAQSLALAIAYAPPEAVSIAPAWLPAQKKNWYRFFPTTNVTVLRTDKIMATVSAYGAVDRYGRGQVSRGGSVTNLWIEGFSETGFAQTSSVTVYKREEDIHMPNETALRPLTPQVECTIDGVLYSNLFEAAGKMTVTQNPGAIVVTTTGHLCSITGAAADVDYRITHQFFADHVKKQWELMSPRAHVVRVIEPFVKDRGRKIDQTSPKTALFQLPKRGPWTFSLEQTPAGGTLTCGEDAEKYWSPFPAVNCYPIIVTFTTQPGKAAIVASSFAPNK